MPRFSQTQLSLRNRRSGLQSQPEPWSPACQKILNSCRSRPWLSCERNSQTNGCVMPSLYTASWRSLGALRRKVSWSPCETSGGYCQRQNRRNSKDLPTGEGRRRCEGFRNLARPSSLTALQSLLGIGIFMPAAIGAGLALGAADFLNVRNKKPPTCAGGSCSYPRIQLTG